MNIGDGLWRAPNTAATNESGFTGLPGGTREDVTTDIADDWIGYRGFWWTTTPNDSDLVPNQVFEVCLINDDYYGAGLWHQPESKYEGKSIRCVKNQ